MALAGTGQFSGLVTLATRPLLRRRNLERRRGFEPRTPGLQPGRSPLAVAAPGTLGVIRTPNGGFGIRLPHHRRQGKNVVGSAGFEPALCTVWTCCLCLVGLRACGVRGEIRTRKNAALNRTRLPELRHPNIGGQSRIRTLDDPAGKPGLRPSAFSLSANCPNANCQRTGGRQATRTPMRAN